MLAAALLLSRRLLQEACGSRSIRQFMECWLPLGTTSVTEGGTEVQNNTICHGCSSTNAYVSIVRSINMWLSTILWR